MRLCIEGPVLILAVGNAVVVSVVCDRLYRHIHWPARSPQTVLNVSRILAWLHPYALFEQGIGAGISPDRDCAFESEAFYVAIAMASSGAACPAIAAQRISCVLILKRFIQLSQQ